MRAQTGNLTLNERGVSAVLGLALTVLGLRRGNFLVRAAALSAAGTLLARVAAGHCALKAAWKGDSSLREGLTEQARRLRPGGSAALGEAPGSPTHRKNSRQVDEALEDTFPASDPPASRLPDEPPANAEAKWDAFRDQKH